MKRLATSTKRRRCVYLSGRDLDVIEEQLPRRQFSSWVRQRLREEYPFSYGGDFHD